MLLSFVTLWSCFSSSLGAGYPIPKPSVISQLEQGEDPWVPDHQVLERMKILRDMHTGEESIKWAQEPSVVTGTDTWDSY